MALPGCPVVLISALNANAQAATAAEGEEGDWDTEWINDETGDSQAVEWFVEEEEKDLADHVAPQMETIRDGSGSTFKHFECSRNHTVSLQTLGW